MFRVTRHQQFAYKPIYYDAEKEKQKKREKARKAGTSSEGGKAIKFKPRAADSLRTSNMRILTLVLVLSAFAYFVITY